MSSSNHTPPSVENAPIANTEPTFDEYVGSIIAGAASIDGIGSRPIVPITYYSNFISEAADRYIIKSKDNERDKLHILRIVEARECLERNYPLLLRAVGASSNEARILQEAIWSAFLIGLVNDREGYQLFEANVMLQQYRSSKGNSVKTSMKEERMAKIIGVLPAIVDRLFDLGAIETVSDVFSNNKRLVESAVKHKLVPDDVAEIFTPSRVKGAVKRLLAAGVLQRRRPEKR